MKRAVLVMAYGTPRTLAEVRPYYTHIRRGSPPPPALLEELTERYRAIGGPTRLNEITGQQAEALARALAARDLAIPVYVGFKHVEPFIGDAVRRMAGDGVTRAMGLVMAPHYSLRSIAEYEAYVEDARPNGFVVETIESWHDDPGLIAFLAARLGEVLLRAGQVAHVIFTAHSVPAGVLERGDPYPDQLRATAALVARRAGIGRWSFAYQSAGRTADPWLGPDVAQVIERLADAGERVVVVQSIGFVADNLEILYDLDIEARRVAEGRGLSFFRTGMPNDHPDFIAALAALVVGRLNASHVRASSGGQ